MNRVLVSGVMERWQGCGKTYKCKAPQLPDVNTNFKRNPTFPGVYVISPMVHGYAEKRLCVLFVVRWVM